MIEIMMNLGSKGVVLRMPAAPGDDDDDDENAVVCQWKQVPTRLSRLLAHIYAYIAEPRSSCILDRAARMEMMCTSFLALRSSQQFLKLPFMENNLVFLENMMKFCCIAARNR